MNNSTVNSSKIAFYENYTIYSDGVITLMDEPIPTYVDKDGYVLVSLSNDNGISAIYRRAVLIAKHFVPNPYNAPQVNHIDGNKLNDDVSNLEWVTAKGNMQHAINTGLRKAAYKDKMMIEITKAYIARKVSIKDEAEKLGISYHALLGRIKRTAKKLGLNEERRKVSEENKKNEQYN